MRVRAYLAYLAYLAYFVSRVRQCQHYSTLLADFISFNLRAIVGGASLARGVLSQVDGGSMQCGRRFYFSRHAVRRGRARCDAAQQWRCDASTGAHLDATTRVCCDATMVQRSRAFRLTEVGGKRSRQRGVRTLVKSSGAALRRSRRRRLWRHLQHVTRGWRLNSSRASRCPVRSSQSLLSSRGPGDSLLMRHSNKGGTSR